MKSNREKYLLSITVRLCCSRLIVGDGGGDVIEVMKVSVFVAVISRIRSPYCATAERNAEFTAFSIPRSRWKRNTKFELDRIQKLLLELTSSSRSSFRGVSSGGPSSLCKRKPFGTRLPCESSSETTCSRGVSVRFLRKRRTHSMQAIYETVFTCDWRGD